MKKIGNIIKIAFLLVVGAKFNVQINEAIEFLSAVDYSALGVQISNIASTIADFAVEAFNFIAGLFESKEVIEVVVE